MMVSMMNMRDIDDELNRIAPPNTSVRLDYALATYRF
jgi:hypothetical protein